MNRAEWQRLSRLRQREAGALLDAGEYAGAYYLIGYAVECALKACIVKALPARSMPSRQDIAKFYTHDVEQLLKQAGLEAALRAASARSVSWNTVKDWDEQARYNGDITEAQARDLVRACIAPRIGVLPWLRSMW